MTRNRDRLSVATLGVGRLRRAHVWLFGRDWWSWDLAVGAVLGVLAGGLAALYPAVRSEATTYLYAVFGGLVGVLGFVLAVLAILVGLMSPSYRTLLEALPGGIRQAVNPYAIVVYAAAVGAVLSVGSALAWPALVGWAQSLALGLVSGIGAWALLGSAQLLHVTFNHAQDNADMKKQLASIQEAKERKARDAQR